MIEEQKVYIRGVQGHGEEVIRELEDLGGKNSHYSGEDSNYIYYISHDGSVSLVSIKSEFGQIIMDNYREIKIPEQRWKDGDILVGKNADIFVVFSNCSYKPGFFCPHLQVYKNKKNSYIEFLSSDVLLDIKYYRLATSLEIENFHKILHNNGKDWDAKKKKLVDWVWKPSIHEAYYILETNCGNIEVRTRVCFNDYIDKALIKNCNFFRTVEEAELAAERVKKALKGD